MRAILSKYIKVDHSKHLVNTIYIHILEVWQQNTNGVQEKVKKNVCDAQTMQKEEQSMCLNTPKSNVRRSHRDIKAYQYCGWRATVLVGVPVACRGVFCRMLLWRTDYPRKAKSESNPQWTRALVCCCSTVRFITRRLLWPQTGRLFQQYGIYI